jgi:enamine deaminase RidA (YjgF/YER057c/UK114 family)
MLKKHNPAGIAPPVAAYVHGMEAPPNARWLYVSGQIGALPDGTVPDLPEAQIEAAYTNFKAVLESADMGPEDIVRLNVYLTSPDLIPLSLAARAKVLGDIEPAQTGVVVAALRYPEWIIEVDGVAAAL